MTEMVNCSYETWLTLNRRGRKPSIRAMAKKRKPYLCERPQPHISDRATRDELLFQARDLIRRIRRPSAHLVSQRPWIDDEDPRAYDKRFLTGFLPSYWSPISCDSAHEIRGILADAAILRRAAITRERPTGRAFYVSVVDGPKHALLYGPLPTQADALRALPAVKAITEERYPRQTAFAGFGTCSAPLENAKPGILNSLLYVFTYCALCAILSHNEKEVQGEPRRADRARRPRSRTSRGITAAATWTTGA